jgi:uncharacterized protein (DUF433 family)
LEIFSRDVHFGQVKGFIELAARLRSNCSRAMVAPDDRPADNGGMNTNIVSTSPDVMSGTPVFAGTRVPVQSLIDCLEVGAPIDEFLEGFPSVSREQIIAFLEEAKNGMIVAST